MRSMLLSERQEARVFIVYQMGKVGSSAMVDALSRAGFTAYQSHFLTPNAFNNVILRFNNPDLSEHDKHHLSSQLQKNLLLYNLLKKYQKYKRINENKLNVITLAREPMDWYFANFLQNIEIYKSNICDLLSRKKGISRNFEKLSSEDVRYFFEQVFLLFDSELEIIPENNTEALQTIRKKIFQEEGRASYKFALLPHVGLLLRPHAWFQNLFEPSFNIDVLKLDGLKQNGFSFHENDYMRLAVIKYENLQDSLNPVTDFFEIPEINMHRVNESSSKPFYELARDFKDNPDIPDSFRDKYYSSRYCQAFNYSR